MSEGEREGSTLDEILELTKENNKILRSMRRSMIWSQVFTFIYWLIILGVAGWSFYVLQPYIEKYWNTYQSLMNTLSSIDQQSKSFPTDIQGILDKVK